MLNFYKAVFGFSVYLGCDFVRKMTPGIRLETTVPHLGNLVLVVTSGSIGEKRW